MLPTADAPSDAAAAAVAIEELVGLDLHALASSDLPEHAAEARTQAAGEQQPLSGESSRSGTAELYVTPREVLGSPAPSAT